LFEQIFFQTFCKNNSGFLNVFFLQLFQQEVQRFGFAPGWLWCDFRKLDGSSSAYVRHHSGACLAYADDLLHSRRVGLFKFISIFL
jgi:hypothetical protein